MKTLLIVLTMSGALNFQVFPEYTDCVNQANLGYKVGQYKAVECVRNLDKYEDSEQFQQVYGIGTASSMKELLNQLDLYISESSTNL